MHLKQIHWLAQHNKILLFLLEKRFLNPQIPDQMEQLKVAGFMEDPIIQEVVQQHLPSVIDQLPDGMYFPSPIAKALKSGSLFSVALACQFHYDFIKVDRQQNWFLKEKLIEGKIKKLFLEHLRYEVVIDRYFVEYEVDQRLDKCYLDCEITPMVGKKVEIHDTNRLQVLLNNGQSDWISKTHFKIDAQEQCFCETRKHGNVLLADQPRFMILQQIQEDGQTLQFGNRIYQLVEID